MKKSLILLCIILSISGCGSLKGEQGDPGTPGTNGVSGEAGEPGTTLIKTYTGSFPLVDTKVSIPEIRFHEDTTFIFTYFAKPSSPGDWFVMSAPNYSINWYFGYVSFYQVTIGDHYKIEIYQHN